MIFRTFCFVLSILGIAVKGHSKADASKHAVKTIKTEYGDIYDCVDFYKQPAFSHPLLKNHSFHPQMRPSNQLQRIITNDVPWKMNVTASNIIPLKDGGCPKGTVPIRRSKKNKDQRPRYTTNDYISGTIYSLGQTKMNPWNAFNGVGGLISIYKPRVLASQYSSGEIIIKGGTDTIIAGWTTNPDKFSDNQTRLFVYSVAGNMHCFNTECGFVLVRTDIPVGALIKPVSVRGDKIYVNKFFIYRDAVSGAWWFQIGGTDWDPVSIGFWPSEIFTGLKNPGTYAACGGEVYTSPTLPPPEMGTGLFPDVFMGDDAYCTDFVVVDNKNTVVYPSETELFMNNDVYGIMQQDADPKGNYRYLFGGPKPN
ncbi:hypothetical protein vseg_016793 [Gypsophila vaccaria]